MNTLPKLHLEQRASLALAKAFHIGLSTLVRSTWLLGACVGLVACKPDPGSEPDEHTDSSSQRSPTGVPSAKLAARVEKDTEAAASTEKQASGSSYLIVIGSWKVEDPNSPPTIPQALSSLPLRSVQTAPGFPRAANVSERGALRQGYEALLAGICDDRTAALAAVQALETEGVAAYIRESPQWLSSACPLPNDRWLLGQELVLAIDSDAPDSTERVKLLLDRGASPNHASSAPLSRAVYDNDLPLARLLLDRGARANIAERAPQEESLLELAIRTPYGDPLEMVQLLVAHGADVNASTEGAEADPGSTVQIAAVRQCRPQVLEFLYAKGTKRVAVAEDEICRDRHPPEAPATDRAGILRLLATLPVESPPPVPIEPLLSPN